MMKFAEVCVSKTTVAAYSGGCKRVFVRNFWLLHLDVGQCHFCEFNVLFGQDATRFNWEAGDLLDSVVQGDIDEALEDVIKDLSDLFIYNIAAIGLANEAGTANFLNTRYSVQTSQLWCVFSDCPLQLASTQSVKGKRHRCIAHEKI